ncbi:Crp/Fnr family transcriptional regulator [Streptosporangium sp. CA-115845]|uniref:Crp/Fnr family transcriptional regulator n=1 Tax=Streptosporangium sp. CA-115845 TaxID=3240071 RepID=UPI003D906453
MSDRTSRRDLSPHWPAGTLMSAVDGLERNELFNLGEPQRHEAGAILIRQGDPRRDHVLLLRSIRSTSPACAKITAILDNGAEALLGIRLSGDLVGEMATLRGMDRSATVMACTPLVAFRIPTATFFAYLNERPHLWHALASMIAERLEWANQRRLEFGAFEVPVRLARVLGDLAARHGFAVDGGTDLGIRLSQPELGRLIGAKEAAVNNAVRLLKQNGLLLTDYRKIVITDLAALRAFGFAS